MTDELPFDDLSLLLTTLRQCAADDLRALAGLIDPVASEAVIADDQLRRMIPPIAHEMVAMQSALHAWQGNRSWIDLERTLLHATLLADFFQGDTDQPGAVRATHFAAGWRDATGEWPAAAGAARTDAATLLGHLTTVRIDDAAQQATGVEALVGAVWSSWYHFLDRLGPQEHAALFRWFLAERAAQWHTDLPTPPR